MEMPPDYICHTCSFQSMDCLICVNTDILPIPIGELDGGPKWNVFREVQHSIIVVSKS